MDLPRFYFTAHPCDLRRTRLVEGTHVLLVASAHWDAERKRFRLNRPPADYLASIAIDSGGFTAAARWGQYPWTPEQYVEFVGAVSRGSLLDWVAVMDYACEREVNRGIFVTNRDRIHETIRGERALRALAPSLPWLGVLQGHTPEERLLDVRLRRRLGLLTPRMGIGSICRRPPAEAREVIRLYQRELPEGTRYHAFGLDVRALDGPAASDVFWRLASWDSYSWNYGAGRYEGMNFASQSLHRRRGESYSSHCKRLATHYLHNVVGKRLNRTRPLLLC